jgi:hypothetical protein
MDNMTNLDGSKGTGNNNNNINNNNDKNKKIIETFFSFYPKIVSPTKTEEKINELINS